MRQTKEVRFQNGRDAHYGYITATGCLYSPIGGTVRLASEHDGTVTINGETFTVEFAR